MLRLVLLPAAATLGFASCNAAPPEVGEQRAIMARIEQLEQRIAEVSSLKSTNEVRRRASQRATNEAAQKSQELARMQRRGGSTESAGTEARRRRTSSALGVARTGSLFRSV